MTTDQAERIRRLERRLERARAAQRESERIAETALRRLYQANELKTVLLGTVNHELRTPATIVSGFAQFLAGQWDVLDESRRRDLVDRIQESASRLAALVEEVLGLASLEAGEVHEKFQEVDLEAVVEVVATEEAAGVDLRHDLEVRHIVAHPTAVRRILANLVRNAVTYGPDGPVLVSSSADGAGVALRVADEGPGIAVEDRTRVFEAFYRGPGDHVLRTSGLGIGLTVAQRLVGLHDGEIDIDDRPGGGCCVTVRLPQPARATDGQHREVA